MSEEHGPVRTPATSDAVLITCRSYDESAASYAEATRRFALYPGLREAALRFEGSVPAGLMVLDLGCGGGRDTRLFAGLGRRVVAADLSMAMLRHARQRSQPDDGTVGHVRLDAVELPFPRDVFGGVWACGSLLHVPSGDLPRALSEMARILVPGGRAAMSMRAGEGEGWREGGGLPGPRWFTMVTMEGFAADMRRAGFQDVLIRETGRPGWFIAAGSV
jgi:SAM-dependent methyltransferase